MTKRRTNILKSTDWLSVVIYLLLVGMGWISIYAAVYNEEHHSILDTAQRYGRQFIWILLAVFFAMVAFLIDSKIYSFFAYIIYGLLIFLLIGVLLFGTEVNNSRSWFDLGFVRFQPAEFAKFATCLALAKFLSTYDGKIHNIKNLIIIFLILALPAVLIILQNDTGSALVYIAFILVLFREGLSGTFLILGVLITVLFVITLVITPIAVLWTIVVFALLSYIIIESSFKGTAIGVGVIFGLTATLWAVNSIFSMGYDEYMISLAGLSGAVLFFLLAAIRQRLRSLFVIILFAFGALLFTYSVDYIFHEVLEPHHRTRINVLLGVEEDIKDAGYNVNQSKIAIGSGGFAGKGFLQGTQTKFDFVPEQSTDFIFCTVGEEWGFVGTTVVISLFMLLILRLIFLAERQRSVFSRIYGYGVASILFFHVAINVGMTIGLAPVIGIPLPFFSYGGSSLWAFTILFFIFIRLDSSRLELL